MDLASIQKEIDRMERQVDRQRREIKQLAHVSIDTRSASDLLARMQDRIRAIKMQRDNELWKSKPKYADGQKVISGTPARRRL